MLNVIFCSGGKADIAHEKESYSMVCDRKGKRGLNYELLTVFSNHFSDYFKSFQPEASTNFARLKFTMQNLNFHKEFLSHQPSTKCWFNWNLGRQRQWNRRHIIKSQTCPLAKKIGNFPSGRTRSIWMKSFSFAGLSLLLESSAKIQNGCLDVDAGRELRICNRRRTWSLINSEDDGERNILSAVATFMTRTLNRPQGYYERSLPAYSCDL